MRVSLGIRGERIVAKPGLNPHRRFGTIEEPSIVCHGSAWAPMRCAQTSVIRRSDNYRLAARDALAPRPRTARGPRRSLAGVSP